MQNFIKKTIFLIFVVLFIFTIGCYSSNTDLLPDANTNNNPTLQIDKSYVTVQVYDDNDNPVEGVEVSICKNGTNHKITSYTSENGFARFRNVSDDVYIISINNIPNEYKYTESRTSICKITKDSTFVFHLSKIAIDKSYYFGTWKSCGLLSENGKYYKISELEAIGNYNVSDFYYILQDNYKAYAYLQGKEYNDVEWYKTKTGVLIGSNNHTLKDGMLLFESDGEVLYFEKISNSINKEDITLNPDLIKIQNESSKNDNANVPNPTQKPTNKPTELPAEKPTSKPTTAPIKAPDPTKEPEKTYTFILNTSKKKYHKPSCSYVDKIAPENKSTFSGTLGEFKTKYGSSYSPCGHCHPAS